MSRVAGRRHLTRGSPSIVNRRPQNHLTRHGGREPGDQSKPRWPRAVTRQRSASLPSGRRFYAVRRHLYTTDRRDRDAEYVAVQVSGVTSDSRRPPQKTVWWPLHRRPAKLSVILPHLNMHGRNVTCQHENVVFVLLRTVVIRIQRCDIPDLLLPLSSAFVSC